uniref:Glycosyl transferase CAP10 domain-containing protein n=1 Tax=Oryza barthii TaxID=65489 RepID=A0A0D3GVF4_9ORYZ
MRGSSNNHKSKSEEEGVALVQVAEEGETTTKQQQQPDSNKAAEEEEEEAGYGYSNWWSTWVSSAVKKRVRAPGRVGIVVVVGGFVLLALLAAVATTTTTTWPQLVDFTGAVDFFSRGLAAGKHYWPIDPSRSKLCRDIRFAVRWGNAHPAQAQRMGLVGSAFATDDMAMDYVYDYMLHVLTRYASLLRYKPTVPDRAVELCPESMACPRRGRDRDFMMQSREQYVADYQPCTIPPPPLTADDATNMAHRDAEVLSNIDKMIITEDKHN